jgi:hypothetical protein
MDRSIGRIAPIVLIAVALGTLAGAATPRRSLPSDRQAIVALEELWIDAKDASTLERLLADDFVHPLYSGEIINKAQHIEWVTKHPRPANRHARFARLDVRLFGDVAQAYGVVSVSDETGSEIRRNVFTDVFVYRKGRWQAVSAQETPIVTEPAGPAG